VSGLKFFAEKLPHASLAAKWGVLLTHDGRNEGAANFEAQNL